MKAKFSEEEPEEDEAELSKEEPEEDEAEFSEEELVDFASHAKHQ